MSILFRLLVQAGRHDREDCPVAFRLPAGDPLCQGASPDQLRLTAPGGQPVPLQVEEQDGEWVLHWIVERLQKGKRQSISWNQVMTPAFRIPKGCGWPGKDTGPTSTSTGACLRPMSASPNWRSRISVR
ncbi:hypothetical protein LJK87_14570 [Paenibacillus sp. P25]|nr:hypothetical protein LJK87_14570 [Paenibacillus sp. P25]